MEKYRVKEGLVTRDIKGVYFVIDIHDKHFYRNKKVNCVNAVAYTIINFINTLDEFTCLDVAKHIHSQIKNKEVALEQVTKDMEQFIKTMVEKGWVYVI